MADQLKTKQKHVVTGIKEAADRACRNIREDARRAIADLEAGAEAAKWIEKHGSRAFSGPNDHLFASEIAVDGKIGDESGGIPLSGAAMLFSNSSRREIGAGSGVMDGPKLDPGRKYRMVVAFQELGATHLKTCGTILAESVEPGGRVWGCDKPFGHEGPHAGNPNGGGQQIAFVNSKQPCSSVGCTYWQGHKGECDAPLKPERTSINKPRDQSRCIYCEKLLFFYALKGSAVCDPCRAKTTTDDDPDLLLVSRKELGFGKYSKWAKDITADELKALCWLVGEFAKRTGRDEFDLKGVHGSQRRKVEALRSLVRFEKECFGVDEVTRLMREAMYSEKKEHEEAKKAEEERKCTLPPDNWECSRGRNHVGPCAATQVADWHCPALDRTGECDRDCKGALCKRIVEGCDKHRAPGWKCTAGFNHGGDCVVVPS